jgi:hypothetical protein
METVEIPIVNKALPVARLSRPHHNEMLKPVAKSKTSTVRRRKQLGKPERRRWHDIEIKELNHQLNYQKNMF